MCMDPMSMMAMGGSIINGIGGFMKNSAEAGVEGANARNALAAGFANENNQRDKSRVELAQQLADMSGRGLDLSSGTPLTAMAESAKTTELDALQIRANAINQSNIYKMQEKNANNAAYFSAAGALIGGAANLYSQGAGSGGVPDAGFAKSTTNLQQLGKI